MGHMEPELRDVFSLNGMNKRLCHQLACKNKRKKANQGQTACRRNKACNWTGTCHYNMS